MILIFPPKAVRLIFIIKLQKGNKLYITIVKKIRKITENVLAKCRSFFHERNKYVKYLSKMNN